MLIYLLYLLIDLLNLFLIHYNVFLIDHIQARNMCIFFLKKILSFDQILEIVHLILIDFQDRIEVFQFVYYNQNLMIEY